MKNSGCSLIFTAYVWLVVYHPGLSVVGHCLYGNDPDCAFQCHCAVDSECSGGECPSGCEGGALGHNWRGPACQIGNTGLNKPANMTVTNHYEQRYPATAALDGVAPGAISSKCAFPYAATNEPAEWWTDLGEAHKIYNITIYGRTDCCQYILQQFDLTVYNTSDNEILCAYFSGIIYTHNTIECQTPIIGRYVHFKRKGGPYIYQTTLCEVVIIGHKYIDCERCPPGVKCNDVTGCEACSASYQPDCKQECEGGFHGTNCQQQCGQCKNGTVCDRKDGTCPDGCLIWWTDSKCTTYIELPQHTNETVTVERQTSNSIEIEWQHIAGISPNVNDFYGYLIQYKVDTTEDNYTEAGLVSYDSDPYLVIENLELNTWYVVKVTAFRQNQNVKEFGNAYDDLVVKTNCSEPEKPTIFNVTTVSSQTGLPYIRVIWQKVLDNSSNCDKITSVLLLYKLTGSVNVTTVSMAVDVNNFVIVPQEKGEYEIGLVVQNNEGYTSASDVCTIPVDGGATSLTWYLPFSVSLNVLLSIVILVLLLIHYRDRVRQRFGDQRVGKTVQSQPTAFDGVKDRLEDNSPPTAASGKSEYDVRATCSVNNQSCSAQSNEYENINVQLESHNPDRCPYESLTDQTKGIYENYQSLQ